MSWGYTRHDLQRTTSARTPLYAATYECAATFVVHSELEHVVGNNVGEFVEKLRDSVRVEAHVNEAPMSCYMGRW